MVTRTRELGQYTTPVEVVDFMISLITHPKSSRILEPAAGNGVIIERLKQHGFANIDAYEIDSRLVSSRKDIYVANFLALGIENQYDVVIGNPPYVHWKHLDARLKEFLKESPLWKRRFNKLSDLSFAFIYAAVRALRKDGELIFITPLFWQNAHYGRWLRQYLLENGRLEIMVDLGEMRLFSNANLHFIIFRYRKTNAIEFHVKNTMNHQVLVCKVLKGSMTFSEVKYQLKEFITKHDPYFFSKHGPLNRSFGNVDVFFSPHPTDARPWIFLKAEQVLYTTILERACSSVTLECPSSQLNNGFRPYFRSQGPIQLGDVAIIANGLVSGLDKAFLLDDGELGLLNEFERQHVLRVVKARDAERYRSLRVRHYIFVNDIHDEITFRTRAPHFHEHLLPFKSQLLARYSYGKNLPWWHWAFLRSFKNFERPVPKIFVPIKERVNHRRHVRFILVPAGIYPTQDMTAILLKPTVREDIRFILGQLNSDLWFRWLQAKGHVRGGVLEFSEKPLERIPIRLINWNSLKERKIHDEIVAIVQQILDQGFSQVRHDEVNDLLVELLGLSRDELHEILNKMS